MRFHIKAIGAIVAFALVACSDDAADPAQPELEALAVCSNSVAVNDIDTPRPPFSSTGASFRVTNLLAISTSNTASCTWTGHAKCLNLAPTTFTLAPGASRNITFDLVSTSPGTGTVTGKSCGGSATANVVVQ